MRVDLNWMGGAGQSGGTSFGIPWKKGQLSPETPLYLYDDQGGAIPAQHEVRAWWPDGSVKWTLHSAALKTAAAAYHVSDEAPDEPAQGAVLKITEEADRICVDNALAVWTILRHDREPLRVVRKSADELAGGFKQRQNAMRVSQQALLESRGRLTALVEQRIPTGSDDTLTQTAVFDGVAESLRVERRGDRCAVVRLCGSHVQRSGKAGAARKFLPFELRLYFYAGCAQVRMVHTFVFDGREEEDFIRGIGLELDLPLCGSLNNRFVRFGGETGLFCESPRSLWTRGGPDDAYRRQLAGEITVASPDAQEDMTVWRDYRMTQLTSNRYDIAKRTGENCVWVRGAAGGRSLGIAYLGGENGGITAFKRDFWQKYPAGFEILDASAAIGRLRVWLYSPQGAPMDMRRYDDKTHVNSCYEGFSEMRASGYGIANTNEVVIEPGNAYPGNEQLVARAKAWQEPARLLCSPQYVLDTLALGDAWGVEDRSTPGRAKIESMLDDLFENQKASREQFDLYGFWDYGDIRHTYDPCRHNWLYDMGGYAWQNTELVPNLWLWYGFLRSGRADYFAWAEAMTRHNSECDLYHLGPYRMLGSRHNVVHWGCGCKECRIGLTQLYKVYYYLTGDERIGDIMTQEKDVDFAVAAMDPLRAYYPPDPDYPAHVRFGPDMMVFAGNWLTQWERTGDTRYRDKLLRLLSHFKTPDGFSASTIWLYEPHTGAMKLFERNAPGHFNYCFGAEYVWSEVLGVLEDEALWRSFLNAGLIYCADGDPDGVAEQWSDAYLAAHPQGRACAHGVSPRGKVSIYNVGAAAYAAGKTGNKTLAKQCWALFLSPDVRMPMPLQTAQVAHAGVHKPICEAPRMCGNDSGQWGSHVITALAHIGDWIDT